MIEAFASHMPRRAHDRSWPAAVARLTSEIVAVADSYVRAGGDVSIVNQTLVVSLRGPKAGFASWKWRFAGTDVEKEFRGRDPAKPEYRATFGDVLHTKPRAHSIDSAAAAAKQQATLKRVLDAVDQAVAKGQKPLIQIDLDLCGIDRTERLVPVLERTFAQHGIAVSPRQLTVLPSSDKGGFLRFVQESGLLARYPTHDWNQVFATYGRERAAAPFTLEVVAPGLIELAAELRRRGGEVGFNTMRPEAERWSTELVLRVAGLADAPLKMMPDNLAPHTRFKADATRAFEAEGFTTVAVFDDNVANRRVIQQAAQLGEGVLSIQVVPRGYVSTDEPGISEKSPLAVSDFSR